MTKIRLTPRERAMEFANDQGYDAWPCGTMPAIYQGDFAKHMAEAWKAGWKRREDEARMEHEIGSGR